MCVTSQPALCGLVLQGSGLQAGASGGQMGVEEERHPLQAQSRTATATQKDIETPPSCDRQTDGQKQTSQTVCASVEKMACL